MKLTNEVKVGVFVVVVALGFAFLILTFGEVPFLKPSGRVYKVIFDEVGGLSKGAEVRVAGIRSGKVKDIRLKDGKVEVVFELDKDITLYKDATAQIGTLGLMGDKYLSITPGTPSAGTLEEGGYIKNTLGYADTDRLVKEMTNASEAIKLLAQNFQLILTENREDIRAIAQNLAVLTDNLNRITMENRENLRQAIANLNILLASLNRTLPTAIESVERLSENLNAIATENRQDIKVAISNLRALSQDLKETLPELSRNLNDLSRNLNLIATENRENIKETTQNIAQLTKRLDYIAQKLERGEGTLGKLITDDELYRNIASATRTFSKAGEVADKTNLYVGFRGELYKAGDTKGILTLKLQPDERKYYLLEIVGNSRGRVYKEEILPNQYVVKKEFKPQITLQYAVLFPVFGDKKLVVRAGLKESTGGVGLDFVYSNRVTFFSDLWNSGRKDRPQDKDLKPSLQVGVEYKVKGPVYVRVGGDDLLNSKLRGAFGGVGLLFTDNDLKYLLGGLRLPGF
ncbi:MlaD family protein [Thermocrinis minervae]|uniref:Phospholipid/cholesterol/gamma-HCH transport system substrate-binding protein n=1 Tax=Thermocrinis minervae TaxID=381751 RepID=A0A1M6SAJ1_9AQUI|nr:MlaD family protein [Thermocrinis minervae]SHK41710.1 phospholipid/cholesterol/gamma-HCH transport system substrate-binding protein [Thermocrinis minervae]